MDEYAELAAAMAAYNDEVARADEQQERVAFRRARLRDVAQATAPDVLPEKGDTVMVVFPWRRGLRAEQMARVCWAESPAGVRLVGVAVDGEGQLDICPPWCLRPAAYNLSTSKAAAGTVADGVGDETE